MSEGFIMERGSSNSAGTLLVTGIAGSTVTVSKGDKSYSRTLDSNGKVTFKGLAFGTWTVTMTDGSSTATRTVAIVAESVELSYRTDLFPSSTVGWARTGWYNTATGNLGYVTINSSSITLTSEPYHDFAAAATTSLIDVTNCTKINMTARLVSSAGTITFSLGVSTVAGSDNARGGLVSEVTMTATHQQTVNQTISVDVSQLTGSYYIVIGGHTGSVAGNGGTLTVSSVWAS